MRHFLRGGKNASWSPELESLWSGMGAVSGATTWYIKAVVLFFTVASQGLKFKVDFQNFRRNMWIAWMGMSVGEREVFA